MRSRHGHTTPRHRCLLARIARVARVARVGRVGTHVRVGVCRRRGRVALQGVTTKHESETMVEGVGNGEQRGNEWVRTQPLLYAH